MQVQIPWPILITHSQFTDDILIFGMEPKDFPILFHFFHGIQLLLVVQPLELRPCIQGKTFKCNAAKLMQLFYMAVSSCYCPSPQGKIHHGMPGCALIFQVKCFLINDRMTAVGHLHLQRVSP